MNKYILATSMLSLILSLSANAQSTLNWTGATDTDWGTAANWNLDAVPTSADTTNVFGPGPAVSTPNQAASKLWIRGGTATTTIADGGALSISSDIRVGAFNDGAANLFVNGGTLTSTGILYLSQSTANVAGSKLTVNGGTVNANGTLRVGEDSAGILEMNGGILNSSDIYVSMKSGASGSLIEMNGGTITTTNNLALGNAGDATMRILDDDATIDIGNYFVFGKDAANVDLEFVLTAGGKTSPIAGKLALASLTTGSRTLTVDGSLADPGTISGTVLFSSADLFGQSQVDTLNDSLNLVGISGYNLALANANSDIILAAVPEPATFALLAGALALGLGVVHRRRS